MIRTLSTLKVQADLQNGGWEILIHAGHAFDYTIPFRAILAEITEALGQDVATDLDLPPYYADEDFVEGVLRFQSTPLEIYYEYSLGFLSLMNSDADLLHDVLQRLKPHIKVV
ncbi:hypothetical protein PQU92_15570 [Asticcacaulis sp. BYS171W]|uniref:Uncharacterized protein n=1 Tax=Asticcacaulis aquaticus TaxID=2984212 RepID=A0ABT5HX95_9CAUL|nr:hypothetical protein [Asticcacaulis aquaticus]MDC7684704.1 hypothetical protein [Asticcacaulis aquaticus]